MKTHPLNNLRNLIERLRERNEITEAAYERLHGAVSDLVDAYLDE
jgi:hypothetical protein